MKTFWVRWLAPEGVDFDMERCWCTGDGAGYDVFCAVVEAESEDAAKETVRRHSTVIEFSFCDEKEPGYMPGGGRFPVSSEEPKEGT